MLTLSGKQARRKGAEAERELARLLGGERVPLSGAAGGSFTGDVRALGLTFEVKRRRDGFRELYKWLDCVDALAVRADRRPWLVVMPLGTLLELLQRGGDKGDAGAEDASTVA